MAETLASLRKKGGGGKGSIEFLTTITTSSAASQTRTYTLLKKYDSLAFKVTGGGGLGKSPLTIISTSGEKLAFGGAGYVTISFPNLNAGSQITLVCDYMSSGDLYGVTNVDLP